MPVFTELYQRQQVASLPDGSLISWLAVPGDPSSESCAFVRKIMPTDQLTTNEARSINVWLAPGNGWAPEGLDALEFPVKVILLGDKIAADDYLPPLQSYPPVVEMPQFETLTVGGTYPRDVALQAASALWAHRPAHDVHIDSHVLESAQIFAEWLTPAAEVESDQISPISFGPSDD